MNLKTDTLDEVEETVKQLKYTSKYSEEIATILQKCIQKAKFYNAPKIEFEARLALVYQTIWLNQPNKTLALFPWLLNKIDTDKSIGGFNLMMVLWHYKSVVRHLTFFANISKPKILELLSDMERRFKDYSPKTSVINYMKTYVYDMLNDEQESMKYMQLYKIDSLLDNSSSLDDCSACRPKTMMGTLVRFKKYQEAEEQYDYIIKENLSCTTVPRDIYGTISLVYDKLGKIKERDEAIQKALKNFIYDEKNLSMSMHLLFMLAKTSQFTKGAQIIESQLAFCLPQVSDVTYYNFYMGCLVFFKKLIDSGKTTLSINKPRHIDVFVWNEKEAIDIAATIEWLEKQTQQFATALDNRNGNDGFKQRKVYYLKSFEE